ILGKAGVGKNIKVKDLAEDEARRIRDVIQEEGQVEGDLRKNVQMDIKRLIDIGCYRGMRHRRNLPVRGQRTHTNARTRKGPRKTGAGKKKAPAGKTGSGHVHDARIAKGRAGLIAPSYLAGPVFNYPQRCDDRLDD